MRSIEGSRESCSRMPSFQVPGGSQAQTPEVSATEYVSSWRSRTRFKNSSNARLVASSRGGSSGRIQRTIGSSKKALAKVSASSAPSSEPALRTSGLPGKLEGLAWEGIGSGPCRDRTYDLEIKSLLLYQLS